MRHVGQDLGQLVGCLGDACSRAERAEAVAASEDGGPDLAGVGVDMEMTGAATGCELGGGVEVLFDGEGDEGADDALAELRVRVV